MGRRGASVLGVWCGLGALVARMAVQAQVLDNIMEMDGRPETPQKVPCDPSVEYDVRWSTSSQRIYLEHNEETVGEGGCATLTSVLARLAEITSSTPLINEGNGVWLLQSDLFILNGITLKLYGTGVEGGGDVDELKFLSSDTQFYNMRAYGGNLDIMGTHIYGYDPDTEAPREGHALDAAEEDKVGRSYISCISEYSRGDQDCTKDDPIQGECRMDIVDSEIDHLGWDDSESYGISWKARGLCTDLSNLDLFDEVGVYGDMTGSDIHHLHYGMYSYGHQGGEFNYNKMHDNAGYGFDPHDDSDYLQFHYNEVYNNGNHNIIASKRCNHVSIQNNIVYDGDNVGIFLHRSGDDSIIRGNWVYDNADAGVALLESSRVKIIKNTLERNMYGVRMSVGSSENIVKKNTIADSTKYHFYTYEGSDDPVYASTGRPTDNVFKKNTVSGSDNDEAIFLDAADETNVKKNTFIDIGSCRFRDSTGTQWKKNTYNDWDSIEWDIEDDACFTASSVAFDPDDEDKYTCS